MLVAIFSTTLFNALSGSSRNVDFARNRAIALGLARDSIDSQEAQARNGTIIAEGVVSQKSGLGVPVTFTVVRANSQISVGTLTDVFKVRTTVSWTNPNGKNDTISLELWIKDSDG